MPTWSGFDEIDERMAALGFCQVLLVVPEEELPRRSFAREDFGSEWSEGMIALHGSVEKSIAAIVDSQRRRVQALKQSRLPSLTIDTSARDWNAFAQQIAVFAQ